MKRFFPLVVAGLLAYPQWGAGAQSSAYGSFEASLRRLGAELTIPGIAYAIVGDGTLCTPGS